MIQATQNRQEEAPRLVSPFVAHVFGFYPFKEVLCSPVNADAIHNEHDMLII